MRHSRMRRFGWAAGAAVALPLAATPAVLAATPGTGVASPAPYSTSLLHFAVRIGPDRTQACDIVGELFRPAGASAAHPVPAILTTNGFGGSYTDQVGLAEYFASDGYAVLTYSGLGFGGSGCKITLDDPVYDGQAASQLVSYLGGAPGVAYTDAAHTSPAPTVDFVIHDAVDHAGHADTYDPRVGMIGGSYGGEVQFAAAYEDPRIDTIVPMITWNDLDYSLAPNNAGLSPDSGVANPVPGVAKSTWALGFSGEGVADGVQGAQSDPSRDVGCPNFADWVCPGLAFAASAGYPDATTRAHLQHASVESYMNGIRIPTLLMQGENDTLFNLNEAVANYRALRARNVPVSMVWQSWGHSGSTPAPGEFDPNHPDPTTQYETARITDWFAHYLEGDTAAPTGPGFAYFRDWVTYKGIATPAYATAAAYPVGRTEKLYLSAGQSLVTSRRQVAVSTQTFTTPGAGAPSSTEALDAVGGSEPAAATTDRDAPGTYAAWSTPALAAPVDVAGIPVLLVSFQVPTAALGGAAGRSAGPAGDLVVFVKLYDVAPDGTASLIHGLVAPARIADPAAPVEITLPGIVHRFAAGHRIELVVAGGDVNYRGGLTPTPVTIRTGSAGDALDLPVTEA
jgi:predicted acyl esterase